MIGQTVLEKMVQDKCECRIVHREVVEAAEKDALNGIVIEELAALFKAFSDPSRLKIVHALSKREMCVCDLAAILEISESAVSHQLRYLRQMRLVKNRRDGNVLYYTLYDDHCETMLATGLVHISEDEKQNKR